jgi:hypothetical protein
LHIALRSTAAALLLASSLAPALAQRDEEQPATGGEAYQIPYVDDRSTPVAVITSYYNAIGRHEYARAYSYYGKEAAPANYGRWERGYADTVAVDVRFGEVSQEGAAGSVYYRVPVKLDVETTDGQRRYFSGCYVLRLANPATQSVPFVPMHIEAASLRRSTRRALPPANCGSL